MARPAAAPPSDADNFETELKALESREQQVFKAVPWLSLRALSYQLFELIDDLLHLGVAALLVGIAVIMFVHILLTGLNGLDVGGSTPALFNLVLNSINNILFVVIVLEILATVVAHLRQRTFALRPLLIIGIISSVRHILIVTVHLSGEQNVMQTELFNQQTVELGVTTLVTVLLVLCYWYVSKADQMGRESPSPRR